MSGTTCDQVAERVALGEPLGEAGEHAASCERCKRLVALPVELGATHHDADPGLGFTARMTAGAQHRIGVRRRRRVAAGLAAAVAATTLGVFAMTREPQPQTVVETPARFDQLPAIERNQPDPWNADDGATPDEDDDDMRMLVQLSDTDRAMRVTADWDDINEPLAPYNALLRTVGSQP
jgi:hypothetical protein